MIISLLRGGGNCKFYHSREQKLHYLQSCDVFCPILHFMFIFTRSQNETTATKLIPPTTKITNKPGKFTPYQNTQTSRMATIISKQIPNLIVLNLLICFSPTQDISSSTISLLTFEGY